MKILFSALLFLAVVSSSAEADQVLAPGETRFVRNDFVTCMAGPGPGAPTASVRACECYRSNSYVGQFIGENAQEQCIERHGRFASTRNCTRLYGRADTDVVCGCYRGNQLVTEVVTNISASQSLDAQCRQISHFAGLDRCRVR